MRIIRLNEKIPVKIDDAIFYFRPMTFAEKIELQSYWDQILKDKGKEISLSFQATRAAIRFSLVAVEGIFDDDGPYVLKKVENGYITDDCIDEVLNLGCMKELTAAVMSLISGIPNEIHDPTTGEVLKNVTILTKKKITNRNSQPSTNI